MVQILEARTRAQISSAKRLIIEYVESLAVDLCFQNFEKEIAEFPGAYARPGGRLLLAVEKGDPVGVVALRRLSDRTCEMKRMYVRPGSRGKGVGRALANRLIKEAREKGYARMRLDTLSRLTEAISLYESLGFKKVKPYTVNPIEDAIYMELDIGKYHS